MKKEGPLPGQVENLEGKGAFKLYPLQWTERQFTH